MLHVLQLRVNNTVSDKRAYLQNAAFVRATIVPHVLSDPAADIHSDICVYCRNKIICIVIPIIFYICTLLIFYSIITN